MKASYPAIPDVGSAIHFAYQITSAPTTFFLDRDHNVLSVHQGYIRHTQLQDMLVQLVEAYVPTNQVRAALFRRREPPNTLGS